MTHYRRVVVAGMPRAGNLGDDLISVILCGHIARDWGANEIGVLCSDGENQFSYLDSAVIHLLPAPRFSSPRTFLHRYLAQRQFAREADVLVIGGGGLFQDTHFPFNVVEWFRLWPSVRKAHGQLVGAGLGVGPLRYRHSRLFLKTIFPCFDMLQVRDEESRILAASMERKAIVSSDIVAGSDVSSFGFFPAPKDDVLGFSLRPCKSIDHMQLIDILCNISREHGGVIRLFTFEHNVPKNTNERNYNQWIASKLRDRGFRTEEYCYGETTIDEFVEAFRTVNVAVAMRFHANILWHKAGVPVLPISYAPKVASLYSNVDVVSTGDLGAANLTQADFHTINKSSFQFKLPKIDSFNCAKIANKRIRVTHWVFGVVSAMYQIGAGVFRRSVPDSRLWPED